jgi:hypothetical protein
VVDEAASNICATSPQAKATAKKVGKEPLVWEAEPSIAIHHAQDHVAAVTAGSYHVSATVDLVNGREVAGHSVAAVESELYNRLRAGRRRRPSSKL